MKHTFDINLVDGHLLIGDNGNIILVDTGSPVTIHKAQTLDFLGRDFRVHTSIMGKGIGDISQLAGIDFTTLLGMDVLSQYRVLFDYEGRKLTFLTEEEDGIDGTAYPLMDILGMKVLDMEISGQHLKMAVDTGAPLSYVDRDVTDCLESAGEKEDFNPMVGRYRTPVYTLETVFGGRSFAVTYGNLPTILAMSLKLGEVGGVIGYDFFRSFKVMLDFRSGTAVIAD